MVSKDKIDNGSTPTDKNNNTQFMDINQFDSNQNVPNDGGSYFNENQELNHNSQGTNNEPLMQFNTMLLESYDSPHNLGIEEQVNEEFIFPFSQEPNPQPKEMFSFRIDN